MIKLSEEQRHALSEVLENVSGDVHISERNNGSVIVSEVHLIGSTTMGWYETQTTTTIGIEGDIVGPVPT